MLIALTLLIVASVKSQVLVTIGVNEIIATARPEHYATNIFGGNNIAYANSSGYINTLKDWNPSFLRFHNAGLNSCISQYSWIDCGAESWNKEKIKDVLEEFIPYVVSGEDVVINIYDYPPWKKTGNNKSWIDTAWYANWCAQLVEIVNGELGLGVKYWEPMNEWDGKGYTNAEMAAHYDACYHAMKKVDPSIKMMGPVTSWIGSGRDFLRLITKPLDVYSSHRYGGGPESDLSIIYERAENFANGLLYARELCDNAGFTETPLFLGEWNIVYLWNGAGAEYMKTKEGACFDALALKNMIENTDELNVLALTVWEEGGGAYSKIRNSSGGFNPGGYLFDLLSENGVGKVVSSTSSSEEEVQSFSVLREDGSLMCLLTNKALNGPKEVSIDFGNWMPADTAIIKKFTIDDGGLSETNVSFDSITTATFTIGESNVVILIIGNTGNPTGVIDGFNSKPELLKVFPNPCSDSFSILTSDNEYPLKLQILDTAGRIVFVRNKLTTSDNIQVSNFSKGVYFCKVYTNTKEVYNIKLLIN